MGLSNTAPEHRNPYFTARQNDKKRRGLPHLNGQIETAWHFHQPFAICFVNSRSRVQVSSPAPRIPHSDAVKSTTLLPRLFVGRFSGRFGSISQPQHTRPRVAYGGMRRNRTVYKTIAELQDAIKHGEVQSATCQAYVDKNELYVYGLGGELLFSDIVSPADVARALGIEDVNDV
jgi:hypothetical protein